MTMQVVREPLHSAHICSRVALCVRRPYRGPQHENYLLRTPDCDTTTPVPVGLQTRFTLSGRTCTGAIESGKYGPLFAVTDAESGRTLRKEKLPQRAGK